MLVICLRINKSCVCNTPIESVSSITDYEMNAIISLDV